MTSLRALPPGFLAAVLITLLRLLVIDIDPPVRDLTDYLPKDEGFYVFPAYDLYERGQAFNEHSFRMTGIPTITNVGAYLGLVLFGDNYLGLRFGSVVFALIALLCFEALLQRLTRDRLLLNALPLVMVSDLSFGFASIVVEPTIARMAMMLVTMVWLVRVIERGAKPRALLLHGAGSAALLLLTYPTNAFVVPACWMAVALIAFKSSGRIAHSWYGTFMHMVGCIAGTGLLFLLSMAIKHDELAFAGVMEENYAHRISLTLWRMLDNAMLVAHANIFRLDPGLGLVFLLSIGVLLMRPVARWSDTTIVGSSFIVLLASQCIFINDYPARKLVILLPLVLLMIAAGYQRGSEWVPDRTKKRTWLWGFLILALAVSVWFGLLHWENARRGSPMVLPTLLPGVVVALVVTAGFLFLRAAEDPLRWWRSRWLVLLLIIPGSISSVRYMITDRTHRYRDLALEMSEYDRARFIGGASLGFRTDNLIQPRLDPYLLAGGYNAQWPVLDGMAKQDTSTNYSIGYLVDLMSYRQIGFRAERVVIMDPMETWPERQFVIYKESR